MDDFNFWWYIIAAVIYFITRSKKKKQAGKNQPEASDDRPTQTQPQKTFEELLKEITEGTFDTTEEEGPKEEPVRRTEPAPVSQPPLETEKSAPNQNKRKFADEESRRVYEESIKMAEGADLEFAQEDSYRHPGFIKKSKHAASADEESTTLASEIRNGLKDSHSARKAIIYSEILNRKY